MTLIGNWKKHFCCKWYNYFLMLTSIFISRQHVHRKINCTQRYLSKCCVLSNKELFHGDMQFFLEDNILPSLQKFIRCSLLILNCNSSVSTNLAPVCALTTHRPAFFSQCLLALARSLSCVSDGFLDNRPLPCANMAKNPTHTLHWQSPSRFLSHSCRHQQFIIKS